MRYTAEMFADWLGEDVSREELFDLLADLANGDYLITGLRNDVASWVEETNE